MAVFRISISIVVFVLLKVRINAPKKYPWIIAPTDSMPINCTKCEICRVYRINFIYQFEGVQIKFKHAFFDTLKKLFLEAPCRKQPTCGTHKFFFIDNSYSRFQNFDKFHNFFIEGAD